MDGGNVDWSFVGRRAAALAAEEPEVVSDTGWFGVRVRPEDVTVRRDGGQCLLVDFGSGGTT